VRCGDDKDRFAPFRHPGEHGAQNPARQSVIVIADGHAFFNFVKPKNAGRHDFGHFEREAEVLFGFAVVFAVENAEIESKQCDAKNGGSSFSSETLAAALDADQEHAPWRVKMLGHAVAEESFANLEPVAKTMHAANLGKFGGFIFEGKG